MDGMASISQRSVYPRVGGGNVCDRRRLRRLAGLSPRGRGKPFDERPFVSSERSIPAWAGETKSASESKSGRPVYPRVGGGNNFHCWRERTAEGLSPRGRGKLLAFCRCRRRRGSIPAWAGETELDTAPAIRLRVYPRVGGGNTAEAWLNLQSEGLSPRGRGKPPLDAAGAYAVGSIPAWAGET